MSKKGLKKERDGVYIDAQGRRVWDKEFFSGRGTVEDEEEEEEQETKHISDRKKPINFASKIGVSMTDGDSRSVGFYCKVCNYNAKDSAAYLDHINMPSHLSRAGISYSKKKSTVEDVRNVLTKKRTREEYDFDKRAKALKAEQEAEKEAKRSAKKQKKEQKKKEEEEQFQGIDDEMAAIMGLPSSFGGKKK